MYSKQKDPLPVAHERGARERKRMELIFASNYIR